MQGTFPKFNQLLVELKPYWQMYLPEKAELVFQEAEEKINQKRLSIQVYGTYNAGKSTLINVLLGQVQAKMAETPTTDKIERYDWQGYNLLDSPGINAPIEHEQVTLSSLKKNDLVLMVIRQGDQDAEDVYERIFTCIEKGKKIFIVLNYNGLDPYKTGEGGVNVLVDHIYTVLLDKAQEKGLNFTDLQQRIKVLPLQLASALKARLAGDKAILLERSGYIDFISEFEAWVLAYDNETEFIRSIHTYIQAHIIEPLVATFDVDNASNNEKQLLLQNLQVLKMQKNALITEIRSQIQLWVNSEKNNILQAIGTSQSNLELQIAITQIIESLYKSLNNFLQQANDNVKLDFVESSVKIDVEALNSSNNDEQINKVINASLESLKSANNQGNIKALLLQLRSLKVSFLKGRWESTLGTWAGKAVPFVNIGISVVSTLHANHVQSKENKQKEALALQVFQLADKICQDIIKGINTDALISIELFFKQSLLEQEEKLNLLYQENDTLDKHYKEIHELIKRF